MNTATGMANMEEENMWAVTLSGTKREYEWAPEDPSDSADADDSVDEDFDPSFKPNHRLLIKSAILHPEAKEGEVTMLQVETTGYNKEKIVSPFVAMKAGSKLQQYVNLLLPDSATIKIISGEGPITLVGSHCVDFYDGRNMYDDDEEDDEEDAESSEDDEVDMEEQETTAEVNEDKTEDKGKKNEAGGKKKTPKKESPAKEAAKSDDKTPKKSEEGEGSAKKKTPKKGGKSPAAAEKMDEDDGKAAEKSPAGKSPAGKKRKASGDGDDGKKKRKGSAEK